MRDVDGTGRGSCPVGGFRTCDLESLSSVTTSRYKCAVTLFKASNNGLVGRRQFRIQRSQDTEANT